MFSIFLISTLCVTGLLGSPLPEAKIVNGTNAMPGEFPYIVSFRKYGSHSCGASIIDATHILTAAHCVYPNTDPKPLSIQYGVTRISKDTYHSIPVKKVVYHNQYTPSNGYHNDIAMLKLESPIPFSGTVSPAILPPAFNATPANQAAVLIGWGYPYSNGGAMKDLQKVDLKVYTDAACKGAHGNKVDEKYHVCAGVPEGGKGQCSGDSGGPLTVNGVQVGIVSWSVKPCAIRGYPGVFAKVANYIDWIKEQIRTM